jgi:mono/diheme cytochrome c family protein
MKTTRLAACLSLALSGHLAAQEIDGAALYAANCVACHQADAQGTPGIAPPLAGMLAKHAETPGGREYVVRVPLTGMVGGITVNGVRYNSNMPSFAALSDAQVAAILGHVLREFNGVAATDWLNPEFVQSVRRQGGTPNDTHKLRTQLFAASRG